MYVTYAEYKQLSGSPVSEADFKRMAPVADAAVDHWTLGRVGRADSYGEDLPDSVRVLYAATVDALPSILSEAKGGERVTSFSNGVDSFTFANVTLQQRLSEQVGWMLSLLPIEWTSACVSFDGGASYEG